MRMNRQEIISKIEKLLNEGRFLIKLADKYGLAQENALRRAREIMDEVKTLNIYLIKIDTGAK